MTWIAKERADELLPDALESVRRLRLGRTAVRPSGPAR
jgi:hypothetical protein